MDLRSSALLKDLLKDVSRSFYLTLRVLPARIRTQIGLAYLLARASDTIADTDLVPVKQRLEALELFRRRAARELDAPLALGDLSGQQSSAAERILLQRLEEAWNLLETLSPKDQEQIRRVLAVITSGQILDLQRFGGADQSSIVALESDEELDDYTYRVAGCVGEFWTRICRAHLFPDALLDESSLIQQGIRFGKGLQLVNILRDLPKDLRLGRCYLPRPALASVGLSPSDLLRPASEPAFRRLYDAYLDRAEAHLTAGWEYTCRLPFRQLRLRLGCAWPILIGVKTLDKLRTGNVLDPGQRVKISRREVRSVILQSVLVCPLPKQWNRLWTEVRS